MGSARATAAGPRELGELRAQFPLLAQSVHGRPLVYLDNAATTLKPRAVLDALAHAHAHELSSVRRGAHALAQRATDAYEAARARIADFLNAGADEVVFVRGTTEALNLVAECWAAPRLGPGDEIVVSELEHHSNLLPWQRVAREAGARVRVAPLAAGERFDLDGLEALLGPATRVVACAHVSHVLGCELPLVQLAARVRARAPAAVLVVDGAQAAGHLALDVQALDCDFYAFSGHKLYGPGGIGVLFGRRERLAAMQPYQLGGGMVARVADEHARFVDAPHRFEAGTPHVAGALGLAAAATYLDGWDRDALRRHEAALIASAVDRLRRLPGVRLFGVPEGEPAPQGLLSFALDSAHPHDVATVLDARGIAVRAGHHCAQPLMRRLQTPGTVRISVAAYNGMDDIDALIEGVGQALELFRE